MGVLRHLPNLITVVRFILIVPVVWCLLAAEFRWALACFAVAGLSDGLDGWLARTFGWTSRFGAVADPLADKVLMGAVFIVLTLTAHVPWWLTAVVLLRDAVIVAGAGAYQWLIGKLEYAARFTGKAYTGIQIAFVLMVLVELAQIPGLEMLGDLRLLGELAVLAFAVLSGGDYVFTWGQRAIRHSTPNNAGNEQ
ncbi:MAG: CDP-alcohol phosphatidyltransferase family protein [Gammaproteobacteria bacterium]